MLAVGDGQQFLLQFFKADAGVDQDRQGILLGGLKPPISARASL
jgi:hypothetical protein